MRIELSPGKVAELEQVFQEEYARRIKAGEPAPFANLMAARLQCEKRNEMIGMGKKNG